jgi:NTP pyrophosphatase (non-canonical NTP hydrolase)
MVEAILKQALNTYGLGMQTVMLCEECAELTKASTKLLRNGDSKELVIALTEEMADVLIMIEQMKIAYQIKDIDVEVVMNGKIIRLKETLMKEQKK